MKKVKFKSQGTGNTADYTTKRTTLGWQSGISVILFTLLSLTSITAQDIPLRNDKNVVIPERLWQNKVYIESFALVLDTTTNLFGFANKTYGVVIPCIYAWAKDFSEGMAAVMDIKTKKWGYINARGDTVIPFQYDDVSRFGYDRFGDLAFNGLAYVNIGISAENKNMLFTDGKWGLINKKGEVVLPIKYGDILYASEGIAAIYEGETIRENAMKDDNSMFPGKMGFINSAGEVIIPPQYDFSYGAYFFNGVVEVKKDGKTFFINRKGEIVE